MKGRIIERIIVLIVTILMVFIAYKLSSWRLSFVYGIKNPTFWQVIMSGK